MVAPQLTKIEIGKRIRRARHEQEYSVREVSSLTGIPESTLKSYERGQCMPSVANLDLLADFFQKPTVHFLRGDDDLALPPGMILVDKDLLEQVLETTSPKEIRQLLVWNPPLLTCLIQVPRNAQLVTLEKARRLNQELVEHLAKHAPKVLREWLLKHKDE